MTILLKNGKIYDGTGHKPYIGSILIEQDRIVSIGKEIADALADEIIDLEGLSVSSGFIDAHSHDCFPKFLRASLLGTGASMECTIRKMTGQTADRFSLKYRGYIKEGNFADITVFNEEALKFVVSNKQKSFGIEKVFINGKLVFSDNHINEIVVRNAGHAIRSR